LKKSLLLVLSMLLTLSVFSVHAQDRLQVVASFSILADVAQNVAGAAADVSTLIPPDADPHAYTPTPSDLAKVADADLMLVNGALLEAGLLETIESALGDKTPVVVSSCVPILPFGEAHDHEAASAPDNPAAARCAAHTTELDALGAVPPSYATLGSLYAVACTGDAEHEHEAEGDHEHEEGGCDPHVWFNPYNVELWTLQIRDTLSERDPANAATYAANAAAYLAQLEVLRQEATAQIDTLPPDKRVLVTDHDALGYFAATYGFQIVGLVVPSVSTVAEPSASQTAALIDTIRAQGVPAIFAGVTVSPTLSQQVADEAGAQFYTLYTESLSDAAGPAPTYLDFIRYNVGTIVDALN
jgi:zinc/manganese transport system substrate-binding protein